MISLYQYLIDIGYTEFDAEETVLRWDNGMYIPKDVKKDINEYYNKRRDSYGK